MANILILNPIIPYPPGYNGNSIRVFPLARELAGRHNCYLAAFGADDSRLHGLRAEAVFKDILILPDRPGGGSALRFLRPLTGHLAKYAQPSYYRDIVGQLRSFSDRHHIDLLLAHTVHVAEFATALRNMPMIMDEIDCRTLALQRRSSYGATPAYMKQTLAQVRARHDESRFTRDFNFVTTVSPVDRKALQELNTYEPERILDIPNGVSQHLLDLPPDFGDQKRAYAFWGALDFPPNSTAIQYFYREVFLPYLAGEPIDWYIIGRNAAPEVMEMARRHDNIKVLGYVEDLAATVSKIPLMINPMQIGGGLKNKVLEAFALGRVVISNSLGMESVPASEGIHFLRADKPDQFAAAITKYVDQPGTAMTIGRNAREFVSRAYAWETIGNRFEDLIQRALAA